MGLTFTEKSIQNTVQLNESKSWRERGRELFLSWKLYPLLFIAAFLRLYHIDRATFMGDEAVVFRMAHDITAHGWWVLTSNRSSLYNMNPPLVVYLFALPAAISANPVGGQILVGLCNTVAVVLTYIFVRRYYGRLPTTIASLLYATSFTAILYSRNIWPQNFLPFFNMLFLFTLFRGIAERRKGWLIPALLLIGVQYQLHNTGIFLVVPLLFTIIFTFRTISLRDIFLAPVFLLLLFLPFIYWEIIANFADIRILLAVSKNPTTIDATAIQFYKFMLSPYVQDVVTRVDQLPTDPASIAVHSPLRHFSSLLATAHDLMLWLFLCALIAAVVRVLVPLRDIHGTLPKNRRLAGLRAWLTGFSASPQRQGVVLLLSWQIIPLLSLIRHSINLEPHYFIIFLPGQFILIALLLSWVVAIVKHYRPNWHMIARYGIGLLAAFFILAQFLGSAIFLYDNVTGHFNGYPISYYPYYSDLSSLQSALARANEIAQREHIRRIYISSTESTWSALNYLTEQQKTPTTVFNTGNCFVLPDPAAGPVIFLSQPYSPLDETMTRLYAHTTLVGTSRRLGGLDAPFKLYILRAQSTPISPFQYAARNLKLLSPATQRIQTSDQQLLTTRWQFSQSFSPASRTEYHYNFHTSLDNKPNSKYFCCRMNAVSAGDQLFFFQALSKQEQLTATITISASTHITIPSILRPGPLQLVTSNTHDVGQQNLCTADGQKNVTLSAAGS